jgi:hypothetical protein
MTEMRYKRIIQKETDGEKDVVVFLLNGIYCNYALKCITYLS